MEPFPTDSIGAAAHSSISHNQKTPSTDAKAKAAFANHQRLRESFRPVGKLFQTSSTTVSSYVRDSRGEPAAYVAIRFGGVVS